MKKRRIFIAINLPENIKRRLLDFQIKWPSLPARWTKENNLHITLVFIGYVTDEELLEICHLTKEAAEKNQPFDIELSSVCLGPSVGQKRLIWTEGEICPELAKLKNNLENILYSNGSDCRQQEKRTFCPHITLARLKQAQWRGLAEKPKIDEKISLSFSVNSIEIMESYLSSQGPDYTVLESISLK